MATPLDRHIFGRIAGRLSPSLLAGFYVAAGEVQNPRKWAIYEYIAKQVEARGEIPKMPPTRAEAKEQRRREWAERVSANWGKSA